MNVHTTRDNSPWGHSTLPHLYVIAVKEGMSHGDRKESPLIRVGRDILMAEKIYEISIAAERLGISTSSLYRMWYNGQVEFLRRGPKRGWRIAESEIERLEHIKAQRAEVWVG
jgi:hypothetical protein